MTKDKDFKALVRARMADTGEPYTAARADLRADSEPADGDDAGRADPGRVDADPGPYALAKIAGMKLCQFYREQYGDDFICAMPTNLYGPSDNFDATDAHLVPMLMRRFHEAKQRGEREVMVWGTGTPRRELMHVDDLAGACLFLAQRGLDEPFVNVGTGEDLRISEIAGLVRDVVHPEATIVYDATKPDGMPRKLLDVSRIHRLGWHHRIDLLEGLRSTYAWYLAANNVRGQISRPTAAA
jgi:GDP-L-fucose synthase